jgi:uncharacterized protein
VTEFDRSDRNRVVRNPSRGSYDSSTIYPIVDAALLCHVGFVQNGQPFVIPTIHVRDGDRLILHGSTKSRMLRHLASGEPLCVSIASVDGLVLARSVFHHSMNYRSAVLFGRGQTITDEDEITVGYRLLTEKIMSGRWEDARQPSEKEKKATMLVSMEIESASAKIRTGPPVDDEDDYGLDIWAGVVPIVQQYGNAEADPRLHSDLPLPDYVRSFLNRNGGRFPRRQ